MKTNIQDDFQIRISVPLRQTEQSVQNRSIGILPLTTSFF